MRSHIQVFGPKYGREYDVKYVICTQGAGCGYPVEASLKVEDICALIDDFDMELIDNTGEDFDHAAKGS